MSKLPKVTLSEEHRQKATQLASQLGEKMTACNTAAIKQCYSQYNHNMEPFAVCVGHAEDKFSRISDDMRNYTFYAGIKYEECKISGKPADDCFSHIRGIYKRASDNLDAN